MQFLKFLQFCREHISRRAWWLYKIKKNTGGFMKKLKKLCWLLCVTNVIIGASGLLMYGVNKVVEEFGWFFYGVFYAATFISLYCIDRHTKPKE